MKKKKLSEIEINASKLNNKDANYYDHRHIPSIIDADMASDTGFYNGGGGNGINFPTKRWMTMIVIRRSEGRVTQLAITIGESPARMFIRNSEDGIFSAWTEL